MRQEGYAPGIGPHKGRNGIPPAAAAVTHCGWPAT